MSEFSLWAPAAKSVELLLTDRRQPMRQRGGGWWRLDADAPTGCDYSFIVDGGAPLADPRSPWQPAGATGPSRLVDHDRFAWSDELWQTPPLGSAIIYELHVGTFTPRGDFDGVIEKLDYLKWLGITHLELMPVHQFSGRRGWGYDPACLFAPQNSYGGPDALKRLVDAAHGKGLGIILDVVYNHFGPEGASAPAVAPYLTDRFHTSWGDAVNLDGPGSDDARQFLIDNALMWLRNYHFDGLRLDGLYAMVDMSAVHFIEQLAAEVAQLSATTGRHHFLIGESDLNDPRLIRSREAGGYGLTAQWNDDFHHALHVAITGEQSGYYADFAGLSDLATAMQRAYVYSGQHSRFRGRRHGRRADDLPADRFVAYSQNHDQVGNRALGQRLCDLVSLDLAKVAAGLVLCGPQVPMLFAGEEWAASTPFQFFTDYQAPQLAESVRQGRRKEFASFGFDGSQVPDPQDEATFLRSKLNWQELTGGPHEEMLRWHRQLIALRRSRADLRMPRLEDVRVEYSEPERWLVLYRGDTAVACNLADRQQTVPLNRIAVGVLAASREDAAIAEGGLRLGPQSLVVLALPGEQGGPTIDNLA